MRATVTDDITTRIIVLEVSGVPDVDVTQSWHNTPRIIRPDHVTIRIVDGEVKELKARGPLVRKSGQPGLSSSTMSWWPDGAPYQDHRLAGAPEWVRTLWTEAPAGVTSWSAEPAQPEVPA